MFRSLFSFSTAQTEKKLVKQIGKISDEFVIAYRTNNLILLFSRIRESTRKFLLTKNLIYNLDWPLSTILKAK
jgi:hypothetical protein